MFCELYAIRLPPNWFRGNMWLWETVGLGEGATGGYWKSALRR